MELSDEILHEFMNGNLTIKEGPLQFQNIHQMYEVLDIAASTIPVSICVLSNLYSIVHEV